MPGCGFRIHAAGAGRRPVLGGDLRDDGENVDRVLDDVRPYLIADGGNVTVVSVEDGVISLKLEGKSKSVGNSIGGIEIL